MARITGDGIKSVSISFFIAEPLGIVLMPLQACSVIVLFVGLISVMSALQGASAAPMTNSVIIGALTVFLGTCGGLIGSMGRQRIILDRASDTLKRYRGPILVGTLRLSDIQSAAFDVYDDDEGGAASSILNLRSGLEYKINPVRTGHVAELEEVCRAINQFLAADVTNPRRLA